MASTEYEIARNESGSKIAHAIDLSFPAFDALPQLDIRLGTRHFEVDGYEYQSAIADGLLVRSQRGIAQDTADFQIDDASSAWYSQIQPYEDVIEDTAVTIKETIKTTNDIFESETVFNGYLDGLSLSESSLQLNVSCVSDMSRTGFLVGGRILTQRYCGALFNINGLRNPQFDACGWITALGGNPVFCTHKKEGTDGCKAHGNEHRYYAVEALSSADVTYTSGSSGWGYGGAGPGCFHPVTEVWMGDGSYKPIHKVQVNDIVWGCDREDNLTRGQVDHVMKPMSDLRMGIGFGRDRNLSMSAEHPYKVGRDEYKPIGSIFPGEPFKGWNRDKDQWDDIIYMNDEVVQGRTRLHNMHVKGINTYIVRVGNLHILVHNNKPGVFDPIYGIVP